MLGLWRNKVLTIRGSVKEADKWQAVWRLLSYKSIKFQALFNKKSAILLEDFKTAKCKEL